MRIFLHRVSLLISIHPERGFLSLIPSVRIPSKSIKQAPNMRNTAPFRRKGAVFAKEKKSVTFSRFPPAGRFFSFSR